ncbi:Pterin-4-alpha-carbinolamine dehydratase [Marinobacterium lacunae]|uniref:Putative pterin-4-alpha-carbinolamine dehydratase n=1 Tax=Marinobacterium lacunae TaxID=1232683 RepID=A0A081FTR2_9GAMM|nr:4a-hydroxytetrahydrobiopterin dehydratase [Marinobacterium lacunae]KEA61917.1 Pterin-4-alpha-carbinolamine dehydratase [Marinobacterium lacunae]
MPALDPAEAGELALQVPLWTLAEGGKRIRREFTFRNFADALSFVNRVGELAEAEDHHPEIRFGWGHAEIELWTHKIGGLHENDFILAAKIDQL